MTNIAGDWVAYNATRFPDAPALENADTHELTSWRQLEGRVSRLAGALVEQFGITKGDRVSMLAENDTRVFEVQFACMRLGAVFVPFNWRLAPPELEQQCGEADPKLIVHDDVWQEGAYKLGAGTGVHQYLSWRARDTPVDLDEAIDRASPFAATRDNAMDDPTHILFTSGTTGRPKGAAHDVRHPGLADGQHCPHQLLGWTGVQAVQPASFVPRRRAHHPGGTPAPHGCMRGRGPALRPRARPLLHRGPDAGGDPLRVGAYDVADDDGHPGLRPGGFLGVPSLADRGLLAARGAVDGPRGSGHRAPATVWGDRARAERLERPPRHGAEEARVLWHPRPLYPGPPRGRRRRRRAPGAGGGGLPGRAERQPRILGELSRAPREPGRRMASDGRRRVDGRGRLSHHRRSLQGHVQIRR